MKRKIEFDENLANEIYSKKLKDRKYSKKLSLSIWKIIKLLCILLIIVFVFKIAQGIWWFNRMYNVELLDELNYKYNEEFTILSKNVTKTGTGTYVLSPKNNESIIFNAYKKGRTTNDDYRETAIKYYTEKYIQENNLLNIKSIENKTPNSSFENFEFLYYDFWIEIASYNEIESTTNEIYKINQFIIENTKSDFMFNMSGKIKKENYISDVQYSKQSTLEELLYEEKYSYINYMKQNNLQLSDVNQEEIEKIWRPKELKLVVNHQVVENSYQQSYMDNSVATYNTKIKDYEVYLPNLINYVDSIEQIKKDGFVLPHIIYNGKEYNMDGNDSENNSLPYQCNIDILKKMFNASIRYDYNNKKLYINI